MTERAEDFQVEVLRAFSVLCALGEDLGRKVWAGALMVGCGLGPGGAALAMAGNIAGAGCLAIEARAEVCRAALRSGACDFVVNSVDEALRILKNEIRQRRPVSVGLTMELNAALEELNERGVQPEVFAGFRAEGDAGTLDRAARAFAEMGTLVVDFDGSLAAAGVVDASARLEGYTRERGLRLELFGFADGEGLRAFDARLLQMIPATGARARWCAAALRFFHRERPHRRVVFLTDEEVERVRS
jgi:urocanate hydratase